jgi:hypothetical protein
MTQKSIINDLAALAPNRRRFLTKVGIASAALGAATATGALAQSSTGPGDINLLNFALNLEYLEAEIYTVATTGTNIGQAGVTITGAGTLGSTSGGAQVTFTDTAVQTLAQELASDEQKHVNLLQNAISGLGGVPVAKPAINLNALGFGFASMSDFLKLARIVEDIGVTAYGGAANQFASSAIQGYAARILAVEAFHSGNIRAQIARLGIATGPALDGADHLPPPSGTLLFTTDSTGLTETRTPGQVLALAYGGLSTTSGGFFPSGLNGSINLSSTSPALSDGATLTANPNPIHVGSVGALGATTISWNAPGAQIIQVRVGSPTGNLLTDNFNVGSMQTASWVTNGMTFYLQDVTNGKQLTSANTLATLVVNVVTP